MTWIYFLNWILILLATGKLSLCAPTVEQPRDLLRLTLHRAQFNASERVDSRFGQTFASSDFNGSDEIHRHNLLNIQHFNFFTHIKVGQPAQEFRVMLDTGSRDLWLPSAKCPDEHCTVRRTYDGSKSAGHRDDGRQMSLQFANGVTIEGQLSVDRLELADGLVVQQQTFLEALHMEGRALYASPLDGVLGISIPPNDTEYSYTRPILSILEHESVARKVFSLSLKHKLNSDEAGELIIGGIDSSLYRGEIAWTPIIRHERWEFVIDSIEVYATAMDANTTDQAPVGSTCQFGCLAMPDTGSHMILGHEEQVHEINALLGAKPDVRGLFKFDDCNLLNKPQLVFKIAGRRLALSPPAYVVKFERGCFSPIRSMGFFPHWIMGEMFIGNLYTVFDYENMRIGFAESVHKRHDGATTFE